MYYAPEVITLEELGIAPELGMVPGLGIVRMRGVDAVRFLQGQLSNDVARLSAEQSILAGYHNPQGRTIALLRLVQWDADGSASGQAAPSDILAVVPRELAGVVAGRLGKFVLRAKVKIADESAAWRIQGLVDVAARGAGGVANNTRGAAGTDDAGGGRETAGASGAVGTVGVANTDGLVGGAGMRGAGDDSTPRACSPALSELPSSVNAQSRSDGAVFVRLGNEPPRWLVISPADAPDPMSGSAVGDRQTWLQLDIAAGLPQVYAATSEEFVAQMLNLDVLNAIAFDKGCYTGQEVIARAHYRGRVKRRMQRFVSRDACHLAPGESGLLADGRAFKVVLATQLPDGRCDFLAVAPLVGAGQDEARTAAPAGGSSETAPATLVADQVSLPYSLPD